VRTVLNCVGGLYFGVTKMQSIRTIDELILYTGKIVVFEMRNSEWWSKIGSYCAMQDKIFGYINPKLKQYNNGTSGYTFSALHNKCFPDGSRVCMWHDQITKYSLDSLNLTLQFATDEQICLVKSVIANGKAKFAINDWKLATILAEN
jgi:hypothetical protein